jgi:hypothetical protein
MWHVFVIEEDRLVLVGAYRSFADAVDDARRWLAASDWAIRGSPDRRLG